MIKEAIGVIIYKFAPIHSGARYCQNFAASNTNPPIIIPNQVARLISEKSYKTSKTISQIMKKHHAPEFEQTLVTVTHSAIDLIQGADDDIFESRQQALNAYPWLQPALEGAGIKLKGITPHARSARTP